MNYDTAGAVFNVFCLNRVFASTKAYFNARNVYVYFFWFFHSIWTHGGLLLYVNDQANKYTDTDSAFVYAHMHNYIAAKGINKRLNDTRE